MRKDILNAQEHGTVLDTKVYKTERGVYSISIKKYANEYFIFKSLNGTLVECKNIRRDLDKEASSDFLIPISEVYAYLGEKLQEWNELGDRKFEPANMWGYNFIRACMDDLETYKGEVEKRYVQEKTKGKGDSFSRSKFKSGSPNRIKHP